ncbi:hypothetical protein IRT45_26565 [Nocardia sp. BSTN01]|uniref:hypothetical protein n=1 Tax=Nocardia sp. BSTN01 TaxID=2783665 RepID=UPI00188F52DD|nr:hypothetical protein [Nocardia sp. BSTN01]MBF5000707.1 hypothetical protein [Nocardia sp. BSTN01]
MTTLADPRPHERREEYAARLIVEANTEYQLEVIDDGSADGLVDYRLLDRDGRMVGALEVGRNTVQAARGSEKAYWNKVAGGRRVAGLTKTWLVLCERDETRFNRLLAALAPLLAELESTARTYVDAGRAHPFGGLDQSVDWKLKALGVLSVSCVDPRGDGPEVFIESLSGYRSALGAETTVGEVEIWLSSTGSDQQGARRKLSATAMPERHMFVWVDHYHVQASRGLAEPELPARDPVMPGEITHLWLAADSGLRGIGGWHWSPTQRWSRLADVETSVVRAAQHFPG